MTTGAPICPHSTTTIASICWHSVTSITSLACSSYWNLPSTMTTGASCRTSTMTSRTPCSTNTVTCITTHLLSSNRFASIIKLSNANWHNIQNFSWHHLDYTSRSKQSRQSNENRPHCAPVFVALSARSLYKINRQHNFSHASHTQNMASISLIILMWPSVFLDGNFWRDFQGNFDSNFGLS